MKNRQLDVTLQSAGLGVCAARPRGLDEDRRRRNSGRLVARIGDPAYLPAAIPAGTYEGQTKDVPAIAIQNFLVTRDGVSTDTVYRITKSMWENLDALVAAHSAGKAIKKENAMKGMPVPLHPGAEKYYREVGILK